MIIENIPNMTDQELAAVHQFYRKDDARKLQQQYINDGWSVSTVQWNQMSNMWQFRVFAD